METIPYIIRLLSLSVYIIDKTGTVINKVKSLLKSWQAFAGFHAEAASSGHWGNVRLTNNIKKLTRMASTTNNTDTSNNQTTNSNYKTTIVVPYISNTADNFSKLCKRRGIQVHFKGTNTLRTALGNPKDKDPKPTRQASYINTNVHTSTVPAHT